MSSRSCGKIWEEFSGIRESWRIPAWGKWISIGIKVALVYAFTLLAWVFFRVHDFSDAVLFLEGIARFQALGVIFNKFQAIKVAGLIAAVIAVDIVFIHRRNVVRLLQTRFVYAFVIALLLVTLEVLGSFGGGAFIYFQF